MSKQRYDIIYDQNGVHLEYHFCRSWDEDGGCYGTNPNHGYSLEDAADEIARHYQSLADEWRNRTHYNYLMFKKEEENGYR